MTTYYRISSIGDALPKRHAYAEAYEEEHVGDGNFVIRDNTAPGAQVWQSAGQVIAAMGGIMDGVYDAEGGYDRILIIESDGCIDGIGDWVAVTPETVTSIRSLPVAGLREEVYGLLEGRDVDGEVVDEDFDLEEYLADEEPEGVAELLLQRSEAVPVRWIETLRMPEWMKK